MPSETLKAFNDAGIDTDALPTKLQEDGAEAFVNSWQDLLETIAKQHQPAALNGSRDDERYRREVSRPGWKALERHHAELAGRHLRNLFADDPDRGERMTAEAAGLYLDYSKNRVTDETIGLLVALAAECGLAERREAMFRGEHINVTEDRAVLHVALRMPRGRSLVVDGTDVVTEVHEVLDRMAASPTGSARATGRGTPASRSAT